MSGPLVFTPAGLITSFTSSFPGTENPLSESGAWITGINSSRTAAQKLNADAHGTMTTFDGTNFVDSVAILANWSGNNHTISATLRNNGQVAGTEIELVLRGNLTASSNTGYEIDLFTGSPSVNFVRWNGPANDFTIDVAGAYSTNVSFTDGAVWVASISGNLVNVTCNGNAVITNRDITVAFGGGLTISSGSPGMGFWNQNGAGSTDLFGWKNFTANAT